MSGQEILIPVLSEWLMISLGLEEADGEGLEILMLTGQPQDVAIQRLIEASSCTDKRCCD